jgi:hypothetical protein
MKNQQTETAEAQGAKAEAKEREKRYSMSVQNILDIMNDPELGKIFLTIAEDEPEQKTPMIMALAKRERKQTKLTI